MSPLKSPVKDRAETPKVHVNASANGNGSRGQRRTGRGATTTTTAQVADWVAQAQATNTWLIIVYHSVSATPTDANNVTPTQLDSQLAAIKASGVKVEGALSAHSPSPLRQRSKATLSNVCGWKSFNVKRSN